MENTIVFEDLIAESAAAAAMDFAAGAMNGAIHKIIQESGGISRDEVATIENLYTKIITEAMDEFVPSEDELEKMKEQLEAAGYKVVKEADLPKEAPAEADGGNDGDEAPVTESADLAAKIAAKLQIL